MLATANITCLIIVDKAMPVLPDVPSLTTGISLRIFSVFRRSLVELSSSNHSTHFFLVVIDNNLLGHIAVNVNRLLKSIVAVQNASPRHQISAPPSSISSSSGGKIVDVTGFEVFKRELGIAWTFFLQIDFVASNLTIGDNLPQSVVHSDSFTNRSGV